LEGVNGLPGEVVTGAVLPDATPSVLRGSDPSLEGDGCDEGGNHEEDVVDLCWGVTAVVVEQYLDQFRRVLWRICQWRERR